MLEESYRLESDADPKDRTYLLAVLGGIAGNIDPARCREWSEDLYRVAFRLPLNWDRIAYEKTALVNLSRVDAERALELMRSLDVPVPMQDGSMPEDVRADAATTVFAEAWKHGHSKERLMALTETADWLTANGQYPYEGMAPVLRDVFKTDELQGDLLFRRAVSYYRTGSRSMREDSDYISMLDQLWAVLPARLKRLALDGGVERLAHGTSKMPKTTVSVSLSVAPTGTALFGSRERGLLYRLMPKVKEVDPGWAKELAEEFPELKQDGAREGAVSSYAQVDGSEVASSAMAAKAQEMATYNAAMTVASTDPTAATRMVSGLPAVNRIAVTMRTASGYIASDPATARRIFADAETQMETMTSGEDMLKLLSVRASASVGLDGNAVAKDAVAKAYDLGEELIDEQLMTRPGVAVHLINSFYDLEVVNSVGIAVARDASIARIRQMQTPVLEALLLAEAAAQLAQTGEATPTIAQTAAGQNGKAPPSK
jgi:hypothetical protein